MKNNYATVFDQAIREELSSLKYLFIVTQKEECIYELKNKYVVISIGLYFSHRINVSTRIKSKKSKRLFGLNLIIKMREPGFDLGSEDIKNDEELRWTVKKHVFALNKHCDDLLQGNKLVWEKLRQYADEEYKKELLSPHNYLNQ